MSDIQNVKVGSTVTELEEGLFKDMKLLREVDFSGSPTSLAIPKQCFKGCETLQRCIYPGAKDLYEDDGMLLIDHVDGNGAYVDTGYVPTKNTKLEFTFMQKLKYYGFNKDEAWIGVMPQSGDTTAFKFHADTWDTTAYGDCFYWARDNNGGYLGYSSENSNQVNVITWTRNTWINVKCYGVTMEFGSEKRSSTKSFSDPPKRPITVFGGSKRTFDFSLKSLVVLEDGEKKVDLVPALDASNIACLYDLVSKKALYSQNSSKMKGVLA